MTEFKTHRDVRQEGSRVYTAPEAAYQLDLKTRCRECEACLRKRASLWRARSKAETERAVRTWFVTLTLSPESHQLMERRVIERLGAGSTKWLTMSDQERFAERWREVSRECTLYLKRLRKGGQPFKYLLVAEAHKSGLPHVHLLVHETDEQKPIRHASLTKAWGLGFTVCKLADDANAASYLCKYLAKSLAARVRASQAYGAATDSRSAALNRLHSMRERLRIPLWDFQWAPHRHWSTWEEVLEHYADASADQTKERPHVPVVADHVRNDTPPNTSTDLLKETDLVET